MGLTIAGIGFISFAFYRLGRLYQVEKNKNLIIALPEKSSYDLIKMKQVYQDLENDYINVYQDKEILKAQNIDLEETITELSTKSKTSKGADIFN